MLHRHRPPRFDQRVDARRPISADLLAAVSQVPYALADEFRTAWFDVIERLHSEMVPHPCCTVRECDLRRPSST